MKAQKTFYPRISIKTLENRLIHARNREFHPKIKSVEANGKGGGKNTSNLLISLDLMSPWVRI